MEDSDFKKGYVSINKQAQNLWRTFFLDLINVACRCAQQPSLGAAEK